MTSQEFHFLFQMANFVSEENREMSKIRYIHINASCLHSIKQPIDRHLKLKHFDLVRSHLFLKELIQPISSYDITATVVGYHINRLMVKSHLVMALSNNLPI